MGQVSNHNIVDWGESSACRAKYRRFVDRVFDAKGAWMLIGPDGPLETRVEGNQWALPLWTSREAASEFAELKALQDYCAEFIALDELLNEALADLEKANLQIHPNAQEPPVGLLIPPAGFKRNVQYVSTLRMG